MAPNTLLSLRIRLFVCIAVIGIFVNPASGHTVTTGGNQTCAGITIIGTLSMANGNVLTCQNLMSK